MQSNLEIKSPKFCENYYYKFNESANPKELYDKKSRKLAILRKKYLSMLIFMDQSKNNNQFQEISKIYDRIQKDIIKVDFSYKVLKTKKYILNREDRKTFYCIANKINLEELEELKENSRYRRKNYSKNINF